VVGSSVETGTLSSKISIPRCLELVAASGADIDQLVFGIEVSALAVGTAVVTIGRVLWCWHRGVHNVTLWQSVAVRDSFHYCRPCCRKGQGRDESLKCVAHV